MLKGTIKTLGYGMSIMKWGVGFRSKKILFLTDVLNHIGYARKKIRDRIAGWLAKSAVDNELKVKVRAKNHDSYYIKYRVNDLSDYQSLGECLGGNMYTLPDYSIKYFIDAGANVGFFSVNMFGRYAIDEAISIEPNPLNVDLLKYNLSTFHNCKVLPIAVSGQDGNVVFELHTSNTGHIKGYAGNYDSNDSVSVVSKKISSLIPSHWAMENTLVKIDIEGAEYEVIPEMFSKNIFPKVIALEIHDFLRCGGAQLAQMIADKGYKVDIEGSGDSGNVCRQLICLREK